MGLLQPYNEPITKEFLLKEDFLTRLNSDQLDLRYNIANMSRDEYADMIESNIFYEKHVIDTKCSSYIKIKYWPDSYHTNHYDMNGTVLNTIADVYKNTDSSMDALKDSLDCVYNLEIEFGRSRLFYIKPMRFLVSTTRDLLDFIALAEVQAKESQKLRDDMIYAAYC
jgi:hypothetical protein